MLLCISAFRPENGKPIETSHHIESNEGPARKRKDEDYVEITIYNSDTKELWRRNMDTKLFDEFKANRSDLFGPKSERKSSNKKGKNRQGTDKVSKAAQKPDLSKCNCNCCKQEEVTLVKKKGKAKLGDRRRREASAWSEMYSNYTIDYKFDEKPEANSTGGDENKVEVKEIVTVFQMIEDEFDEIIEVTQTQK